MTLPNITADQKLMTNLKYFIIAILIIGGRFFLLGSRHQERSIPSAMFESSGDPFCLIIKHQERSSPDTSSGGNLSPADPTAEIFCSIYQRIACN